MTWRAKVVDRAGLVAAVARAREKGAVVVQCHGCFDILHPGHLRHLSWAKEQGDLLVVSVSADGVVQKGARRPYVPQHLRAENLAALEMVDVVTIDDGEWAGPILEIVRPDVYVKGREFEDVHEGRFGRERRLVESYGGRVRFSSGDVVYSSTEILERHPDRLEPVAEQLHAFCARQGITPAGLRTLVSRFETKKVLVVGETIVDRYVYTDPLGMSADSPVLAVRPKETETFVGGAAIVAQHVRALGAEARLVTIAGDDAEAETVRETLRRSGVRAEVGTDKSRPTIVKTRYVAEGKKLLNVNVFRDHELDRDVEADLLARLGELGDDADAVVVADFSYGVVTGAVLDWARRFQKERGAPVTGDVQCSSQLGNVTRLAGITLVTASEREGRLSLCDRESGVADLGARLLERLRSQAVVLTLAARGMMLLDKGAERWDDIASPHLHEMKRRLTIDYLPTFARHIVDPMGAGDALLATLTTALAAGGSVAEAAFLGNCAAAVEVERMGNIPVRQGDLLGVVASIGE